MRLLSRFMGVCILMLTVGWAYADTQTSIPDSAADGLSPVYSIKQCHFRIENLNNGGFSADGESGGYTGRTLKNNPVFVTYCYANASEEVRATMLGATQSTDGKWTLGADDPSYDRIAQLKTYPINGKNWTGRVVEYRDTTGEPVRRTRHYNFCLFETGGPQILCGELQESLMFTKRGTEFNKALAVIKTIVFVDPPTAVSPTAAGSDTSE